MIVIIVPAKAGSSRLPNKNMAMINGRPMIDYTIDQALASRKTHDIYISTDSDEIEEYGKGRGLKIIRRASSLGGETPLIDVYRHTLKQIDNADISIVVGLQPDHPDRNISVDEAIAYFESQGDQCDMLYSIEKDGTKNGAHYVMSKRYLLSGVCVKKVKIVDDCTNVHYDRDLKKAAERLKVRQKEKTGELENR